MNGRLTYGLRLTPIERTQNTMANPNVDTSKATKAPNGTKAPESKAEKSEPAAASGGAKPANKLGKLFDAYEAVELEFEEHEKKLAELRLKKSEAVKAIFEHGSELGFGAGPYNRKGRQLTVVKKIIKADGDQPEGATYFFKGPRGSAVEV